MEKELNPREEQFLELLEQKDFSALSAEEQLLVSEFCSPEEYALQRRMLVEANTLFDDHHEVTPLIIGETTLPFWKRPVPLYQALTGIAATIALFFSIWPAAETEQAQNGTKTGEQTASVDTVYLTRTIRDTVIRYKSTSKTPTTSSESLPKVSPPRILEVENSMFVPLPVHAQTASSGRSLKEDAAAGLYLSTIYQYTDR